MNLFNFVEIFTDGACKGNPGPGGWGALLKFGFKEKELFGGENLTTNNRMELIAVINAINTLKYPCKIILYTDSQYVQKGISEWIYEWKKNNWLTTAKLPVKNKELWVQLDLLIVPHNIEWRWIKGHSNSKENKRADELANKGIKKIEK